MGLSKVANKEGDQYSVVIKLKTFTVTIAMERIQKASFPVIMFVKCAFFPGGFLDQIIWAATLVNYELVNENEHWVGWWGELCFTLSVNIFTPMIK